MRREEELKKNPYVAGIDWGQPVLTPDFRIRLFQIWKDKGAAAVVAEMSSVGLGIETVGYQYQEDVIRKFEASGFPFCRLKELDILGGEQNPLILSGKFTRRQSGTGINLNPEFEAELYDAFPEMSIEDGLRKAGLDPRDLGKARLKKIERIFTARAKKQIRTPSSTVIDKAERKDEDEDTELKEKKDEDVEADIQSHPYVQHVWGQKVKLKDRFYEEAVIFMDLGIERVLEIFEIKRNWISEEVLIEIGIKLSKWELKPAETRCTDHAALQVYRNQERVMTQLVSDGFAQIGKMMPSLAMNQKRIVCEWIHDLPRDPWGYYTVRRILDKVGLSKSTYYEFLNNKNYGRSAERRSKKEAEDILLVRQVSAYKGYQKGYRQIYMMMESVTGQKMSIHRVLNLMRKDGIRTTIRRPSKNRKAMKELIQRNGQPNLLDRRFRQYRPNQVRLTDVTYMDYGDDQRAYGSASIDPVTGRLICFVISENNDLQLALDTLEAMDAYPAEKGGIIHSDQGILYFTDDFQAAVKERDLIQSMSRRGNCWDNAPQESFFGHFKDECKYERCKTVEELRCAVQDYGVYYNEERHMWGRNRMTPVEYEAYLTAMSDEKFAAYLAAEESAWQKQKEKSAKEAAERGRSYRESVGKAQEEYDHGTNGRSAHI